MVEIGKLPFSINQVRSTVWSSRLNQADLQRLVLQQLVQWLVPYNQPSVQTGRPNLTEPMQNGKKLLVFFEAYK